MTESELQNWLHQHIPATALLGVQIKQADCQTVRLQADFAQNHNHHGTIFGGSTALLATACAWLSAFVQFPDSDANIVIKNSKIDYIAPANGDVFAICQRISVEQYEKCQKILTRFGKGLVSISCVLFADEQKVAIWQGEFVIYQNKTNS